MGLTVEWHNLGSSYVVNRGERIGEHAVTDELALVLDNGGGAAVVEGSADDILSWLDDVRVQVTLARGVPHLPVRITFDTGDALVVPFRSDDDALGLAEAYVDTVEETGIRPTGWPETYDERPTVEVVA